MGGSWRSLMGGFWWSLGGASWRSLMGGSWRRLEGDSRGSLMGASVHPCLRALSSHIAVIFFCAASVASAFSLVPSQVSIPILHLSASFWYWEDLFLASKRVLSTRRWFSWASASLSFSSSDNRYVSISSLFPGSCFIQSKGNINSRLW